MVTDGGYPSRGGGWQDLGMKLDTITYKGFPVEALKTAFTKIALL